MFAAPRVSRQWRFAPTRTLVFKGRRRVYAYGALLNIVIAALAGVTILGLSTKGGTATLSTTGIDNYLSRLPVKTVPGNIAHASTCDPSLPDVSAQLQAWITSLPNYTVARLGANQCYHTEYPITIGAKTLVVFDGNNSTLASYTDGCDGTRIGPGDFVNCRYPAPVDALGRTPSNWPRSREHLILFGNKQLIVTNLHIEGGKASPGYDADYAFQHGIAIEGTNDGDVISNVTVDHVWGDYVNFQAHIHDKILTYPQHVTIENSHFGLDRNYMGTGRQGFSIGIGVDVHIENNVIQYSSRSAIDIEPDGSRGGVIGDIYIEHNTFGPHGNNTFANHSYGTANPTINNIYFLYNTLKGTPLLVDSVVPNVTAINANDPATFRRHNYQFIGNVSNTEIASGGCPGTYQAMRFWGIDGLVIQNNTAPVGPNRCMTLIDAAKIANARVTGNTAPNAIATARRYYQSVNICQSNNMISNNPLAPDASTLAPPC